MPDSKLQDHKVVPHFARHLAFIIGIDKYAFVPQLGTAVNDASKLAEVLQQHNFEICELLLDENANSERIRALLSALPTTIRPDDRVLIYFAGHGTTDEEEGFLVPVDGDLTKKKSLIAMDELVQALNSETVAGRHLLLVLDCCFAGAIKWSGQSRSIGNLMPKRIYKERFDRFILDPAWQVITSAAYDQKAMDAVPAGQPQLGNRGVADQNQNHSPFAYSLLRGLSGDADAAIDRQKDGDGVITATELYSYIRDAVEQETISVSEKSRQTPRIFPLAKHDKGEFIFLHPRHYQNLPPRPNRKPYKGPEAFREEDRELFYGRDREIARVLNTCKSSKLVVVTGASGCGKTSLVQAGLLPRLREQGYRVLPVIRPGTSPLKALEKELDELNIFELTPKSLKSLAKAGLPEEILAALTTIADRKIVGEQRFNHVLRRTIQEEASSNYGSLIEQHASVTGFLDRPLDLANNESRARLIAALSEQKTVLVIDAYDELAHCDDPGERQQFELLLRELLDQGDDSFRLILTVRADLEPELETGRLAKYWQAGRCDLSEAEPEIDELRAVIDGPALQEVLKIESPDNKLVDDIVNAIYKAPAALPLLSYVLSEMYNAFLAANRPERVLTQEDYRQIGGVEGALFARTGKFFEELDAGQQAMMRKLLLRMVAIKDGLITSRRVKLSELVFDDEGERTTAAAVIQRLVEARLVVQHKDFLVPGHEALVRAWPPLQRWIARVGEEKVLLWNKLREEATDYKADPHRGKLWDRDPRLDSLSIELQNPENWLNQDEIAFVHKSLERKQRIRRLKFGSSIALSIVLSALTTWALINLVRVKTLKYYDDHFSTAMRLEEKAGRALQEQDARELQKSWLYTLAALGQDVNKDLTVSKSRLIRQGVSAQLYQQIWASPGALSDIKDLIFAPDGSQFAIAGGDGTIRFCDITTGLELPALNDHADSVFAVAYSPDSKWLAAAAAGAVKVWDVARDSLLASLSGHRSDVLNVAFNPGRTILASASRDSTIRLWNLVPAGWCRVLLSYAGIGRAIAPFDTISVLRGHRGAVLDLAFSPKNRWLATAGADSTVLLWDVYSRNRMVTLPGPREAVFTVAFSPDGRFLAAGTAGGTIFLWHVQQRALLDTLRGHDDSVRRLAFSPAGDLLASGSDDRTIRIWHLPSRTARATLQGHDGAISGLAFNPDTSRGLRLVSGSGDRSIRLWEADSGKELAATSGHRDRVNSVALSENDSLLASGSVDGTILIWDRTSGEQKHRLSGHRGAILSIAFGLDDSLLVSGGADKTVRLWDPRRGLLLETLSGHTGAVKSVAFDASAQRIASGSTDKSIRIWRRTVDTSGRMRFNAAGTLRSNHQDGVHTLAFHPSDTLLVAGDSLGRIILWRPEAQEPFRLWDGHLRTVTALAFNRSGSWLASAAHDNVIRLWHVEPMAVLTAGSPGPWRFEIDKTVGYKLTRRTLQHLEANKVPDSVLVEIEELQDTRYVGDASFLGTVQSTIGESWANRYESLLKEYAIKDEAEALLVYDAASGVARSVRPENLLRELRGHDDDVLSVAFSPDDSLLASGSADETIRLWSFSTGSELAMLDGHQDDVYSIAFSHRATPRLLLASASWDKSVRLWDVGESCNIDTLINSRTPVRQVAISPAGNYLASVGEDHLIRRWRLDRGRADSLIVKTAGTAILLSVAFSANDSLIALGSKDDMIRLWDMKSGKITVLEGHSGDALSVAFSRDGRYLASGSSDQYIRVWDLQQKAKKPVAVLAHQDKVRSVAFSPVENMLASAGSDKLVRLWYLQEQEWRLVPRPGGLYDNHRSGVWSVAFSPDGNSLATGSWDNTVHLWNFRTDRSRKFTGHRGPVLSVAFSPDGRRLASGSWDRAVRLWDVQTGHELDVIKVHRGPVAGVAFDAAGKVLITASRDRTIRLRDLGYLHSFELNNREAVRQVLAEVVGDTSAPLRDLRYLTSAEFNAENLESLPFQNIYQAYSYLYAFRFDGGTTLIEEMPKFYLQASNETVFTAHPLHNLRRPRPQHTGPMQWAYQQFADSLRVKRR